MTDFNELIAALSAAEADMFINGPDGGRREAFDQAQANLWWAQIAKRYAVWTGREGLLAQWSADA